MSNNNHSPALNLSNLSIKPENDANANQIDLSLDLSIGRAFPKSTNFQNSMDSVQNSSSEMTANVESGDTIQAGDTIEVSNTEMVAGDLSGNNQVQAMKMKRKREEIDAVEPNPDENSSEMERVDSSESFKDGVGGSNGNLSGLVSGTACSDKDSEDETVVVSSDFKASGSLEADASKSETGVVVKTSSNEAASRKPSEKVFKHPLIPYVSTKGNGPNGRKVYGFLYKYTSMEVSIMCVCHGNSFTPAEFVEHAGGVNIANPLRHITVMPFTL